MDGPTAHGDEHGEDLEEDSDDYETEDPNNYAWTMAAFESIQCGKLERTFRPIGKVHVASVRGACPRCHHQFFWSMPVDGVGGVGGVLGREVAEFDVMYRPRTVILDVSCQCADDHVGAPTGAKGCGIAFRVEFKEDRWLS